MTPLSSAILAILVLKLPAGADTVTATFTSATTVPVSAVSYTATGNHLDLSLAYAPATGANLTVINNTGAGFITGTFDNLPQGQLVALPFGVFTYEFVANYYGGSGNDLELVWAMNRIFAWGSNQYGQLGDNSPMQRYLPEPMTASGVLAGKTVIAMAAGIYHSLALCSDGTVAAWGRNNYGQLGDNTLTQRNLPVAVNTASGVSALFSKKVVAIAAAENNSLALCSDGTVATWGRNDYGQLGDGTQSQRSVPVAVNTAAGASALCGKTVTAIAAGDFHCLALCTDGTMAAWGSNYHGNLGDNSTTTRYAPVAVTRTGVLSGKSVTAISTEYNHCLALCGDGTVVAWGRNSYGQLGNGNTTNSSVPVAVVNTGVLSGRTVTGVVAAGSHSLALCSDGRMVSWGYNTSGQLGDGTAATQSTVPVEVTTTGVLAGKSVTTIAAGVFSHNLALCSDGTLASWGNNTNGQLGIGETILQSNVPVALTTSGVLAGKALTKIAAGYFHSLALEAVPCMPDVHVTGNGLSIQDGAITPGLANHTDFGSVATGGGTVVRTFTIQNSGNLPLNLAGTPKVAVSGTHAADFTVTQQPDSPVAAGGSTTFQITFAPGAAWLRSATLSMAYGRPDPVGTAYNFAIQGTGTGTLEATYATGSDVPLTTGGFTATGSTVHFALDHAPATGAELMVVSNTGTGFINGTFDNLPQGQLVASPFGGITYEFVANYYGGSGNDLVLAWANNRILAWGYNDNGQLGDNSTAQRQLPVLVTASGVLADKTVTAIAAGRAHSLALCSDGTVAAWGSNSSGQLGDNTTAGSLVPVPVNTASGVSALFGKAVTAIAAGGSRSLALCSDGTVAAWGNNTGDGTSLSRPVPVAVNTAAGVSALFGKVVTAIAADEFHSLALCSDGTVVAWGRNNYGQLGDNSLLQRNVPVAVNTDSGASALFGKTVTAIAAGGSHSLALCSDGTVAAWGGGITGDGTTLTRPIPVAVNTAAEVSALFGKAVTAIGAGFSHNLALCSDGTAVAWGANNYGQLGDNSLLRRNVPVAVNTAAGVSTLFGRTVVTLSAGGYHNLALCSGGTVAAWGRNDYGQLGDNTALQRPVPVTTCEDLAGRTLTEIDAGLYHTLALEAVLPASEIDVTGNGAGIPDGDTTPATADCSDFGVATVGGATVMVTFTIRNTGNRPLNLTGTPKVVVSGADTVDFTVTRQPDSTVAAGGEATFDVTFSPGAAWLRSAALTIASNDRDENPYEFAIQGWGTGPGLTIHESWRQTYFGDIANSGDGADLNDFDKDGIPNLLEYAFGLHPKQNSAGMLPRLQKNGSDFGVSFTQSAGVSGITYGAEWSQTLLPGSWTPVADTGTAQLHTFNVPIATAGKLFMRLKVSNP